MRSTVALVLVAGALAAGGCSAVAGMFDNDVGLREGAVGPVVDLGTVSSPAGGTLAYVGYETADGVCVEVRDGATGCMGGLDGDPGDVWSWGALSADHGPDCVHAAAGDEVETAVARRHNASDLTLARLPGSDELGVVVFAGCVAGDADVVAVENGRASGEG